MLDKETKSRIDECRDILVGKLPDPKSQIEQITIALIYKFMYDMDKEAVELGGNLSFSMTTRFLIRKILKRILKYHSRNLAGIIFSTQKLLPLKC